MIKLKKIITLFLTVVMAVSLVGCSGNKTTEPEINKSVEEREYNYLTGEALSSKDNKTARPVAVMINNSKVALPQTGVSNADIVYEMVTEGGVTRLMAVYSNIEEVGTVGSVRSVRDQFIEFVLPLNAILVNIGSSTYAKDMLNLYQYQNIDGITLGTTAFVFDNELNETKAAEHCWYTNSDLIRAGIEKAEVSEKGNIFPAFNFVDYKQEARPLEDGVANIIKFDYSEYSQIEFNYDVNTKQYAKKAYGVPHIDALTDKQLSFDNVFILNTDIGYKIDLVCTDFNFESGTGYYFYQGNYQEITWEKGDSVNPLVLRDLEGDEITVNVGKSYVGFLGNDKKDTFSILEDVPENEPKGERVQ